MGAYTTFLIIVLRIILVWQTQQARLLHLLKEVPSDFDSDDEDVSQTENILRGARKDSKTKKSK